MLSSSLNESGLLLNNDFTLSQKWNLVTLISPVVRVPVLPTQISWSVAHVWIASKFFIKILSFFKLFTESAIAIETATGNPSGIATINKTTEIIAEFPIYSNIEPENIPLFSLDPKKAKAKLNKTKHKKQIIEAIFACYPIYFDSF